MTDAFAPVAFTASATVSKSGMPSKSVPPFPGATPATICVPYSLQSRVWSWPVAPNPWVSTLVSLSTRTLTRPSVGRRSLARPPRGRAPGGSRRPPGGIHGLLRAVLHVDRRDDVELRLREDLLPLLD